MPNSYTSSPLMVATMPQYHLPHHSHHGPGDHNFAAATTNTASPRLLPLNTNTGSGSPATPLSTVGSASPVAFPRRHLTSLSQSDTQQTSPLIPGSPMPRLASIPSWRSPYLASRPLSVSSAANVNKSNTQRFSTSSSLMEDVLLPGDIVGEGRDFAGSELYALRGQGPSDVAPELEVIRKLGSGSYAVVYLVKEVLSRSGGPGSSDDHATGRMDEYDAPSNRNKEEIVYGREFALKCLSKLNLVDDEALAAQMTEVTIHQSLPDHDNIVTLHRTFETAAYLLLLLEYVPGEDLFYFLEQARDHMDDSYSYTDSDALGLVRTPPTPSLLSNLAPHQLLSRTRLRLVASMFGQMCEAVAVAHGAGVYHRDIKPENFIVTDGRTVLPDGRSERKVVVKLSDFGLSTMDEDSADMDCGSAPYMSYECRNNIAPTYKPRAADVWSLGIVLINMLYHINPWSDAADGACASFSAYRAQPVPFFMARFPGMTGPVAEYLSSRIFNILDDHLDDSPRATAAEFGAWARNLPDLLGPPPVPVGLGLAMHGHHQRVLSTSSAKGHPLAMASAAPSSRPASRAASRHGSRVNSLRNTPAMRARSLSRGAAGMESPILGHALAHGEPELSTIMDESQELEEAAISTDIAEAVNLNEQDVEDSESRSQSTTKRRKRGARKGKGAAQPATANVNVNTATGMAVEAGVLDDTLNTLASASQSLARELSRQKQLPHPGDLEYNGLSSMQTQTENVAPPSPIVSTPQQTPAPPTTLLKKASKWKLSFGKSSSERVNAATASALVSATSTPTPPVPDVPQHLLPANLSTEQVPQRFKSATATNVQSLIMGLSPSATSTPEGFNVNRPPVPRVIPGPNRGRTVPLFQGVLPPQQGVQAPLPAPVSSTVNVGNSPYSINHTNTVPAARRQTSPSANSVRSAYSGHSGRIGGGTVPSSAASSVYAFSARSSNLNANNGNGNNGNSAGNWRMSTSSAATSTSAFTRYSNGSRQSVSTMATSVSGESWRSGGSKPGSVASVGSVGSLAPPPSVAPSRQTHKDGVPVNVKIMNGIPWELDQLPRGQYPKPEGDIFGQPPPPRTRKPRSKHANSALNLGSIDEAGPAVMSTPVQRSDAATSTTDLSNLDEEDTVEGAGPKKVQKGQINALAKMLSALRR